MALARSFINAPRVWARRDFGLLPSATNFFNLNKAATVFPEVSEITGFENRAYLTFGTGNTSWRILAGCLMGDVAGSNMTVTVTVTGSLTIIQSGLNITVQVAAGGSTPAAIVAAILAAFPVISGLPCNSFLTADIPTGTGAGTYATAVAKQTMKQDQRYSAGAI